VPIWGWIVIGAAFYGIMTYAGASAWRAGERGSIAFILIVAVMITDAAWNYVLFRLRRLDWAFFYLFPYTALVIVAMHSVTVVDSVAGALIAIYVVFLAYDLAWVGSLKNLNPQLPNKSE
jgi:tryptophan-rich sensory protein